MEQLYDRMKDLEKENEGLKARIEYLEKIMLETIKKFKSVVLEGW